MKRVAGRTDARRVSRLRTGLFAPDDSGMSSIPDMVFESLEKASDLLLGGILIRLLSIGGIEKTKSDYMMTNPYQP